MCEGYMAHVLPSTYSEGGDCQPVSAKTRMAEVSSG